MSMSLEEALDEERREVLALLEGTPPVRKKRGSTSSVVSARANSPLVSPRSPMRRSLGVLGVDDPSVPKPASMLGESSYLGKPLRSAPIRSMLDVTTTLPKASSRSAHTSPTEAEHKASFSNNAPQHRSFSDASSHPASFGPRATLKSPLQSNFQISGYLSDTQGAPAASKRYSQGSGWAKKLVPTAMAEVVRGGDLSTFGTTKERIRNHSVGSTGLRSGKSRSPHNRWSLRSSSPKLEPSRLVLRDGRTIDANLANRKLSDSSLARSEGGFSMSSSKGGRRRTNSGDASDVGGARLEKSYSPRNREGAVADSSEDDSRSSDEENQRGRRKAGRGDSEDETRPVNGAVRRVLVKSPKSAQSQKTAADKERKRIAAHEDAKYQIRSLLDPAITVTAPPGDRAKPSKSAIHPHTSFDEPTPSGLNTPVDSDTEADITDIKRAQKLSINMTAINAAPTTSRSVRTIYRGDFSKMQKEALDNQRRVRKYLVATDLSDEAAHALEWTIGTVLRDGDTLLAIYCVDEEVGISVADGSGDDAQMKEQAAAVAQSAKTSATPIMGPLVLPSPLVSGLRLDHHPASASSSPMGRTRTKTEQERHHAVQDITERVAKLLRKTKLQVKVVIEVIHCKSPKHLITEVIDYISPTLVILGSRGRSALKGVILGSFSNYLVTKSSVPVMVARKRLRKHTKYKRPQMRLANNLSNPTVRTLAHAKID